MSNDMLWNSDANISFNAGVSNLDDGVGLRERGRSWYSNINYSSRVSTFALGSRPVLPHSGCHNIFGGYEMNLIKPCSFSINKLTANTPTMTVDYGGLYHSQSPKRLFMCTSGLKIIISQNSIPSLHLRCSCSYSWRP
ncbi:hypothetical protein C8R48DRAFT_463536 [Suillus tomentosus]|nr:hypothetical protein C8R48DRAFT_463536 [Suillus tomentosus]